MSKDKLAHFRPSEDFTSLISPVFLEEKERIQSHFPDAIVELVGSSAIPGALTMGDLDVQVRVTQADFTQVTEGLKELYRAHRPELWTEQFALFRWKDHPKVPIGVVVTVIDSAYDDFSKVRDLFRAKPELLEQYNALKRSYEGKDVDEYRTAKKAFFGPNGEQVFLKKFIS